jgi:FkbH-like protein
VSIQVVPDAGAGAEDPAAGHLAAVAARLEWQPALFAQRPDRRMLLRLKAPWPLGPRRIRFHRNHGIELALSVLRPFLEYAGVAPEFVIGDYDDSLTFGALDAADLEVVWLDYARFADRMAPADLADWLGDRLRVLRGRSAAPVLVLDWDGPAAGAEPFREAFARPASEIGGVYLADRRELLAELDTDYFDAERSAVTGTRMSQLGAILTARLLGTRWLPALLAPRLKAIVVDLDNTLHAGVLGEDGAAGVALTDGHARLQRRLLALRDSGLFLALLSRNDESDVRALFATRADFPVGWDDFPVHRVSWQAKSDGLREIARELRIDPGAVLFVDDNPGELLEATHSVPGLHCLHARPDADETVAALDHFPGLWAFAETREDGLRSADSRANRDRDAVLAQAGEDVGAYYRELAVTLTVTHDAPGQLARIAELSGKTNQFNLALRRLTGAELPALLADPRWQLSTAQLEDRLSDSGVIAIAITERRDSALIVHDLCISCRALGRALEDLIVGRLVAGGPLFAGATEVVFPFVDAPRNAPARSWLARFAGRGLPEAPSDIVVPATRVAEAAVNPHVIIEAR